jgi:hypothetical protein
MPLLPVRPSCLRQRLARVPVLPARLPPGRPPQLRHGIRQLPAQRRHQRRKHLIRRRLQIGGHTPDTTGRRSTKAGTQPHQRAGSPWNLTQNFPDLTVTREGALHAITSLAELLVTAITYVPPEEPHAPISNLQVNVQIVVH